MPQRGCSQEAHTEWPMQMQQFQFYHRSTSVSQGWFTTGEAVIHYARKFSTQFSGGVLFALFYVLFCQAIYFSLVQILANLKVWANCQMYKRFLAIL